MDRRVLVAASSSLNDSLLVIFGTEQVSPEIIKINSSAGLAFFVRKTYLKIVNPEDVIQNAEFLDEEEQDIIDAGLIFSCEAKASEYLSRREECRFKLTQKLLNKKYQKYCIDAALDYLEEKNYLNDSRFCRAWLNTRKINHYEGRAKLSMELLSRGISKDVIKSSLDEFYTENSEFELCQKALLKFQRQNKENDKIISCLIKAGFSYQMIKQVLENY